MLAFSSAAGPTPKCISTHGTLSSELSKDKLPPAKKPLSTILQHAWCHTVDLVLPQALLALVWDSVEQEASSLRYSRVHMNLADLIEAHFFSTYIKSGNIEMLSEGRPGIDPLYTLRDGILRLELPKQLYERAGLTGKPIPDGGRKHVVSRFSIDLNLRLPSMADGKKGFERIKWAFNNVLTDSVTWLFRDASLQSQGADPSKGPIAKHHPLERTARVTRATLDDVLLPSMETPKPSPAASSPSPRPGPSPWVRDEAGLDLLEWLGLVALQSARIRRTDAIDPFLSRYAVPGTERDAPQPAQLALVRWHGFIPASWTARIVGVCIAALSSRPDAWFALSGAALHTEAVEAHDGYTILMLPLPPLVEDSDAAAQERPGQQAPSKEKEEMDIDADANPTEPSTQREFLLWELVNAITPR